MTILSVRIVLNSPSSPPPRAELSSSPSTCSQRRRATQRRSRLGWTTRSRSGTRRTRKAASSSWPSRTRTFGTRWRPRLRSGRRRSARGSTASRTRTGTRTIKTTSSSPPASPRPRAGRAKKKVLLPVVPAGHPEGKPHDGRADADHPRLRGRRELVRGVPPPSVVWKGSVRAGPPHPIRPSPS